MNKPFVSFIVMSYKAEKFIQEAIDGALAQTYDNMEIIFSDDASPDKTFEIIKENIKNYSGKHKNNIRVIRNEKNLGIGAHLNKLWWQEAKGDWIVVSAGDDISLPNRVEVLMQHANNDVALIHHYSYLIDENSNIIPHTDPYKPHQQLLDEGSIEDVINRGICVRGATMCLNSEMLKTFRPFNADIVNEDIILAYRAKYYGKIIHIDEKLMKYREHSGSISYTSKKLDYVKYINHIETVSKRRIAVFRQVMVDNAILKLPDMFINKLQHENDLDEISYCLYSNGEFKFSFLYNTKFYIMLFKRIILKPYLFFRNK